MRRLLCIVGRMNAGGAETFLMKMFRHMDREKYQMDFCVADRRAGIYDEEIRQLGGEIYYTVPKSKSPVGSFVRIYDLVRKNKYMAVMRISQNALSGMELLAARLGGAERLVFRSSNTHTYGGRMHEVVHFMFRPFLNKVCNVRIAPSTEAGVFMFGRGNIDKVHLLHNALDLSTFRFDGEVRKAYREDLGIGGAYVVGHIGRFNRQKNHSFLLRVFACLLKKRKNAVLLLVGEGELESEIRAEVADLGLEDHVRLMGVRQDIAPLLFAMDVFVFPSLFEGLPNTVVEAQTTGLPCVIADTITREVCIADNVHQESLLASAEKWCDAILSTEDETHVREDATLIMREAGYDIRESVREFEACVFGEQ